MQKNLDERINATGGEHSILELQHLQQIGLFLWRRGIELFIIDSCDHTPERQAFLDDLWHRNRTSLYLDDIWERGARTGEILLYMRPHSRGYRLLYYDASQFEPYYDDAGDLWGCRIYSVEHLRKEDRFGLSRKTSSAGLGLKADPNFSSSDPNLSSTGKVEVVTDLGRDRIDVWRGRSPQDFTPDESFSNPYGFVPAVVVQNRPIIGGRGKPEFDGLREQIEQYNWFVEQVSGNVEFFGGPLFYSSRSRTELIESGLITSRRSVAAEQGYGSISRVDRVKLRQVIDGLEEGEQIGFATPQPIDSQVFDFIERYRSSIISALGGRDVATDDPSSATANAIPVATATRRANSYVTHGLADIYQMALEMAVIDGILPPDAPPRLYWRYAGDIFPDTPQTQLTKSIVSRNLIRLGVNLHDAIHHVFPDKRREEISQFLHNGFAYELLNGVAQVGSRFTPEDGSKLATILEDIILKEVENARGESRVE